MATADAMATTLLVVGAICSDPIQAVYGLRSVVLELVVLAQDVVEAGFAGVLLAIMRRH